MEDKLISELLDTLESVRSMGDSWQRNKKVLLAALQSNGLPSSWLSSWGRKFVKVNELLEKSGRPRAKGKG